MKKGIKILICVIISVAILVIIYAVLVIAKVLPNPFLDTKDLMCSRETELPGYIESEIIVIEFNKDATIKTYKEMYKITFENVEELKTYKEYLDSVNKKHKYDETDKSITIEDVTEINEENGYYKKTKKEMKNMILNELYFSVCD